MPKMYKLKFAVIVIVTALFGTLGWTPQATADPSGEWELIVPTGEVMQTTINPAPRITSLDGKTIVLRWNGKHNGLNVLNYLAERMGKQFPTATIVKSYELNESINFTSGNNEVSQRTTEFLKSLKPDIVIASQAD